jgi:hypothetical protein
MRKIKHPKVFFGVLDIWKGHYIEYVQVTRGYNSASFMNTFDIKRNEDDEFGPWEEATGNFVKFKLDSKMAATLFLNKKKKKR